jgi:hypothetical protein
MDIGYATELLSTHAVVPMISGDVYMWQTRKQRFHNHPRQAPLTSNVSTTARAAPNPDPLKFGKLRTPPSHRGSSRIDLESSLCVI